MNHTHINLTPTTVLLLTMIAILWGCSKDDLADNTDNRQVEQLSLTVVDDGYTSDDAGGIQTRTTENGYKTIFTPNDYIGLYAVDSQDLLVIKNACLSLRSTSKGLQWQPLTGGKLTVGNAVRFFVYYPHNSSLTTVNTTATTAEDFFANKIQGWKPNSDQSVYSQYSNNDLMVGSGNLGEAINGVRPLNIKLRHQMGLAVISLPKTRYALSSNADYTWIADDANLTFVDKYHSSTPCRMDDGTYRYLVKPAATVTLNATFTDSDNNPRQFNITPTLATGSYKTYTIDGGVTTDKTYTLQTGDFYFKDASLMSKDKVLNSKQKKACIGVILKIGKAEDDTYTDDCQYTFKGTSNPMSVNGYVLAIKDANSGYTTKWGAYEVANNVVTTDRDLYHFSGYKNTQDIISYANTSLYNRAPATHRATEDYERSYPAPTKTSGWFLPSAGQCKWWSDHRDELSKSVKATGNKDFDWTTGYWSSTEQDASNVYCFKDGSTVEYDSKTKDSYKVRSCLVF